MHISMGAMDGTTSWLLRSSARMRMLAVTARQRWAGRQFFQCGVAHTCPPGHIRYKSGPKKKMLGCKPDTWHLDLQHHSRRPPAVGRVLATLHTSALKVRAAQPTHPHTDHAPALSVRPPAKPPSTRCGTRPHSRYVPPSPLTHTLTVPPPSPFAHLPPTSHPPPRRMPPQLPQ